MTGSGLGPTRASGDKSEGNAAMNATESAAKARRIRPINALAWAATVLFCLIYAPMAIDYFSHGAYGAESSLWVRMFATLTDNGHALGTGSVEQMQQQPYQRSHTEMWVHTAVGGVVILLACLQFSDAVRTRYRRLHKLIGRVQVSLVVTGMVTAMLYLLNTGPAATYNGPAFYVQLWFLAAGTLSSSLLAVRAVLRGELAQHRRWMTMNFTLLLSAPMLRLLWIAYYQANPTLTQLDTNYAAAITLGVLLVPIGFWATRLAAAPLPRGAAAPGLWSRAWSSAPWAVAGVVGAALCALSYQHWVGAFSGHHSVLLGSALLVTLVMAAGWLRCEWRGHAPSATIWRMQWQAACLCPFALLATWWAYAQFFPLYDAFFGAVMTAPAGVFTLAFARAGQVLSGTPAPVMRATTAATA